MWAMLAVAAATAVASIYGAKMSNDANEDNANNMMNFQKDMSNTAHQREQSDLAAGGLNPILSAMGNGASTPTGAMADNKNILAGLGGAASTAMAAKQQEKDFEAKDAGIQNTKADTANKGAQTAGILNANASSAKDIEAKTMSNEIMHKTMQSQIKKAKATGDYAELNEMAKLLQSGTSSAANLTETATNIFGGGLIKSGAKAIMKGQK